MPGKVTIATVASHAQVSRQTVSNVINAPHLVRQETRDRVREVIEALGYRASQAARQMRTGRSGLIAVRIGPGAGPDADGTDVPDKPGAARPTPRYDPDQSLVADRFLHGLTEAAAGAGYRIVLYTAAGDEAEIAAYDELLARHGPDGFVLTGTHHGDPRPGWLAARGVAFVTFGRPWGGPDRHPWVDVDGARGVRDATERLLAAGHRRVGFIGWPAGNAVGDDRCAGWLHALRAAGVDPTGLLLRAAGPEPADPPRPPGGPRRDGQPQRDAGPGRNGSRRNGGVAEGERAAARLLAGAGATALVCASDGLALGALRAVAARPAAHGTAVIGFDDTPAAWAAGVTSVAQPLAEAAAACVTLLTRLLDGPGRAGGHEHVLLRPRLVVRDSG